MTPIKDNSNYPEGLKEKWRVRFDFFEEYGTNGEYYRQAFKELSFSERINISFNFFGFFFGIIYWLILGMWRKALALLGLFLLLNIVLAVIIIGMDIPENVADSLTHALGLAVALSTALYSNRAYYLHVVHHSTSWNPFES